MGRSIERPGSHSLAEQAILVFDLKLDLQFLNLMQNRMMRRRAFQLGFLLACVDIVVPGLAQQGHPLTGTWNGDFGPSPTQRTQITIVMTWDGKETKGTINPGPDSAAAAVFLDVINWTVRIEADMKDQSGKLAHVVADGKLEDIGNYHRTISGAWKQGGATGSFKLTRD